MSLTAHLPGMEPAGPPPAPPAGGSAFRWFRKRPSGAARRARARAVRDFAKVNGGEVPPPPRPRRRIDPNTKVALEAHVLRKDVIFKMKAPGFHKRPSGAPRGEIKRFSAASARRFRLLIRNTDDMWSGFVTLTYPGDSFNWTPRTLDGPTCKRHVHAFCSWLRRKKIPYVWILEFQERGAPHFHFLVAGYVDKAELARRWFDIVGSGDMRHLHAGTRVEAVKNPDQVGAYMGSYLTKLDQKTVPAEFVRVGRFWGASRVLSKTLFRMKGLYRDVAAHIRLWRSTNGGIRRQIAADQLRTAELKRQEAAAAEDDSTRAKLLKVARSCEWRASTYAKRWRWKGEGFTLLRGADSFKSIMRQSVFIDSGQDPGAAWESWDGTPDARPKWISHEDHMRSIGQYTLDGGFEPAFPVEVSLAPGNPGHVVPEGRPAEPGSAPGSLEVR